MKLLAIFTLSLSTYFINAQEKTDRKSQPNILFICVDDLRPELPSFGKDYIKAPHMEKLFSEGRLFKKHYVQSPTCGISRLSLLAGIYPDAQGLTNRSITQHDHINNPTFPAHFRNNGYYTAAVGKVSHYPGNLSGTQWADPNKPEIPNAWDSSPQSNGEWKHAEGLMHGYANGKARVKKVTPVYEDEDARYPDDAIMDGFKIQLQQVSQQQKPWLLAVGLLRPHLPFACHSKHLEPYKDVRLPSIPANKKPANGEFWHSSGEFMNYKQSADPRKDQAYADNVRKHYAACVTSSDEHIGDILQQLKDAKLDDNTIVVLWSDHGWHLGEQQIWGKHSPYAVALHSPLCIKLPKTSRAGIASDQVVETVDIYPTLCELANIPLPDHLDGNSLAEILANPNSKSDGTAIAYWKKTKSIITQHEHKIYTWKGQKQGELTQHYNLRKDPHEATNLVK